MNFHIPNTQFVAQKLNNSGSINHIYIKTQRGQSTAIINKSNIQFDIQESKITDSKNRNQNNADPIPNDKTFQPDIVFKKTVNLLKFNNENNVIMSLKHIEDVIDNETDAKQNTVDICGKDHKECVLTNERITLQSVDTIAKQEDIKYGPKDGN